MPETNPAPPLSRPTLKPLHWRNFLPSGWIFPLGACFILLWILSAKLIGMYDLGTHLRAGEWIIQHSAFPSKDTFTYTQTSQDYLDSNGFYQILLYSLQKTLGYSSLTLFNMLVLTFVYLLFLCRLQLNRLPPALICLLFLLSLLMMERRFVVRPEIFSWLYLNLTLWILDLRTQNKDRMYLLPLIQLLWVNTEGLFILGWLAMGIYALGGWFKQKRWDPKLIQFGLFSLLADLLNPYFLKGMFFPLLLWTRLGAGNLHKQRTVELFTPWHYLQLENLHFDTNLHVLLFFGVSSLLILTFLWTWKKRKFHEWALLGIFGYLACSAVRNIPLFALVGLPLLGGALKDWGIPKEWNFLTGKKSALAVFLLLLLLILRTATNAFYVGDRRMDRVGLGLNLGVLPVQAAQFLQDHHLDGRILNHLNFGGWLDWRAPQPTFIDGRSEVMSDDFFQSYDQSFEGTGLNILLNRYQPQLILADYNSDNQWKNFLNHSSDWRLIYLDGCCALWARQDYAPQIPSVSFADLLKSRNIPDDSDSSLMSELTLLRPSAFATWFGGFYRPQTYDMGDFALGLFALSVGEYRAAREFFMEGYRDTNGDYGEVYYNLAVANLHLAHYDLGRLCLEYTLELDPHNASAQQMLTSLGRR